MHKKSAGEIMKHFDFMLIDLISLYISYVLAYFVRLGFSNPFENVIYKEIIIVVLLLAFASIIASHMFDNVLRRGYYIEMRKTMKQVAMVFMGTTFYLFAVQNGRLFSRLIFLYCGVFYFLISYITRLIWKQVVKKQNQKEKQVQSLVILTNKSRVEDCINYIKEYNYYGYRVKGIVIVDEDRQGEMIDGYEVIANRDTIVEYVCREWVDEVFISIPDGEASCQDLANQFLEMGVVVHQNLKETGDSDKVEYIGRVGKYTVLTSTIATVKMSELFMKRVIDILGGIVGCCIALVLALIIGPIIYVKSPGPIFFKQTRMGKNGRKFQMYKFRSMYLDAEERKKELMAQNEMSDGRMFKVQWDTRIIGSEGGPDKGIGNFIRKYSLDEWPQFFNILKGEMSLVGTRPPTVDEWEQYELHHRARLAIKPGLTGLWQVSGRSNIKDFEEVVKLDTEYIAGWKFKDDVKILFKTVKTVFKHEGAM